MKFVDRVRETERLQRALGAENPSLVVVFGRRRIGKSTLVQRLLTAGRDIYFQADETQLANQLQLLARVIGWTLPSFDRLAYPDWYALLEALNYRVAPGAVLCLDEFPYLVKSFPALPSVLQRFWDTAHPRFHLVLCGSSQQSMYTDVLNERSPLYGRADCIIHLQPLELPYLQEAMALPSARDAVINYAFWGGVPRYWQLSLQEGGLQPALSSLLFAADGTLYDEPGRLLRDELRDLTLSRTLLSAIGNGQHRISEMAGRLGKSATELSAPLRRLVDLGMVARETPFGEDQRNSKRSLYYIADPFLDAYYRFVAPNVSLIASGAGDAVRQILAESLNGYVGAHWERLCRRAVTGRSLGGVTYGPAARWWGTAYDADAGRGIPQELDVVSLSLDRKHLLVGECKWTAPEDSRRLLAVLEAKARRLPFTRQGVEIHPVLFLREPPKDAVGTESVFLPEDVSELLKR